MTPDWSAGSPQAVIEKFRQAVLAVPDVVNVDPHPRGSKVAQNNEGNHFQPHTFALYSSASGKRFLEFELTRNNHDDKAVNFTVAALFKLPPLGLVKDAWRILHAA